MNPSFGDIFSIFLAASLVQPWLRQKMLDSSRNRLIRRIERQRGSRVILLVHREESMSFLGFPFLRYIDINDAEQVIRAIRQTDPEVPLDLVLHTPGGIVLASLQIARAIKTHKGKVTVLIPHYAMSGGTLIALAAVEIVMDSHAVLGPVDPPLGDYPAASLVQLVKTKNVNELDDRTLILAAIAEKCLQQIRAEVLELLANKMPAEKAADLANKLTQGTWMHDHPIGLKEAQNLGLPIGGTIPAEFYQLMILYPPAMQSQIPRAPFFPTLYGLPTTLTSLGERTGRHP